MEEILHHQGCIKPCKNCGINYQPQLVSQISAINSMTIFWAGLIYSIFGFWGAHFLDPYKLRSVFPLLQLGGWVIIYSSNFSCCRSIPPSVPIFVLDSRCTSRSSRAFTAAGPVKVTKPSSQPAAMTWRSLKIHPGRLTWNTIMEVWKIIFLSKWVICRFHVSLPGCRLASKLSKWRFAIN